MPTVFFIRHAESTWNAYGDLSKDAGITDKGVRQASLIEGKVSLVILSPLRRTKETLVHSKLHASTIMVSPLCREVRGGTPCDYLEDEDVTVIETEEEIQQRISDFKSYIDLLSTKYETIAIISHYCFISKITDRLLHNCQIITHNF